MNQLDTIITSFNNVSSFFEILSEYHEKQHLDNLDYKNRSTKELTDYINAAQKSEREMGECYDYHNYDPGVEAELRHEEMAAQAQLAYFNEQKEQHLISLLEMKLLFLYKEVEIKLKVILSTKFSEETGSLSNLNKIERCFNKNNINIKSFNGYTNINNLRLVSNDLKHSLKINVSRRLQEFQGVARFNSSVLDKFIFGKVYDIESFFKLLIDSINGVEIKEHTVSGDIPF